MSDEKETSYNLDEKAVDAIALRVVKHLKPKEPPPWDEKTERRAAERRKPKDVKGPKIGKVGGIISYVEKE